MAKAVEPEPVPSATMTYRDYPEELPYSPPPEVAVYVEPTPEAAPAKSSATTKKEN